jgi:hypothetical protein
LGPKSFESRLAASLGWQAAHEHHDETRTTAFAETDRRKIQDADWNLPEGGDIAAVLRKLNVTWATNYRWCNQFGGRTSLRGNSASRQSGWDEAHGARQGSAVSVAHSRLLAQVWCIVNSAEI